MSSSDGSSNGSSSNSGSSGGGSGSTSTSSILGNDDNSSIDTNRNNDNNSNKDNNSNNDKTNLPRHSKESLLPKEILPVVDRLSLLALHFRARHFRHLAVLGNESRDLEHLSSALAVRGSDQWRVDVGEVALSEERVRGKRAAGWGWGSE